MKSPAGKRTLRTFMPLEPFVPLNVTPVCVQEILQNAITVLKYN